MLRNERWRTFAAFAYIFHVVGAAGKRKKKRLKSCLELIMNHEEEHYLPSSPPEEEAQRNNTMLMHDEKQEGILRFMNRDKDIDVWGVCMSDATREQSET